MSASPSAPCRIPSLTPEAAARQGAIRKCYLTTDNRLIPARARCRRTPSPGIARRPAGGALEELIARAEKMEGEFEERTRGARAAQRDEGRQGTPRAPADRGHAGQVREARPRVPLGVGGREASPRPLTGADPSPGNRPAPAEDRLLVTAHAA